MNSTDLLAIEGGVPVRSTLLPYGRQLITPRDIRCVTSVLRSDWVTTGPKVIEFERVLSRRVGTKFAVVFSSGTAALHASVFAAGLKSGNEAITSPLTFCATSNAVLYQGARPIFADVKKNTLTLDPIDVSRRITSRTKAIMPVDYAGHPADLSIFRSLAERHHLVVIEDACHALGAVSQKRKVGQISHMTVFSFHPVKHITTGEGGAVTTDDPHFFEQLKLFRNHGIVGSAKERQEKGHWFYEMSQLGYNYRLSDISCALGISQLARLESNLQRRKQIAARYMEAFRGIKELSLPSVEPGVSPAWHLFVIQLNLGRLSVGRAQIFRAILAEGIGVNVHYLPVYQHPYYKKIFGDQTGQCPIAEAAYEQILSLPLSHAMTLRDADDVIQGVRKVIRSYACNGKSRRR